MKHIEKLCIFALALVFLLALLPGGAQAADIVDSGTCGDNLTWTLDSDGVLTISGTGAMTEAPWRSGHMAEITKAVVSNGVTNIGDGAFAFCSVMTEITIPNSVTSIGDSAFAKCFALESITIPSSVTSIGHGAFERCWTIETLNIPYGVKTISEGAFMGCYGLTSVTIPSSVTTIGNYAFNFCTGLTSVTIPAGVTSIGNAPFVHCDSLTEINVASGNSRYCSVNGILFNKAKTELVEYPVAREGAYAIPNSVTTIGDSAFGYCTGLTGITIPSSVTSIEGWAFYNCKSLTSVTIPAAVTSIGEHAFALCEGLTSIIIPSGVTSIANDTFYGCSGLTSVTIPAGVTSIGEEAFRSCSSLTGMTIPSGVTTIGGYAFLGCSSMTSLTIPASVTSIGYYSFSSCSALTDVYYGGTQAQWTSLSSVVPGGNECLTGANVHFAPKITKQPSSVTAAAGSTASFKVTATDAANYQWYYRTSSAGSWSKVSASSGKTANYSLTVEDRHNGYQYRCLVKNAAGSVYTNTVTLTVSSKPVITTQPTSRTVDAGSTASFKVVATGATSYQWYYRTSSSGSWTAVSASSGKTATYSLTAAARHNGYQYRCKVTNAAGSVNTNTVTLTVTSGKPVITTQPASKTVAVGGTAKFTVTATGATSYQWYYRTTSSGSWTKVSAASGKTAAYSLTAAARHNGYQYYCKVTNASGSVDSSVVTLKVKPKITAQPTNKTVSAGTTVHFTVTAENAASYQWYYRTSSTGEWTAVSASSGKTADYSLTAAARHNGYQYRCKVMNATSSVYTNTVTLTVN